MQTAKGGDNKSEEQEISEFYTEVSMSIVSKHCYGLVYGAGTQTTKMGKDKKKAKAEEYKLCLVKNKVFLGESMMHFDRDDSNDNSEGIN